MNNLFKSRFANPDKAGQVVRKIIALGIACMLLFAVASCNKCDFDLSELYCHPELGWVVELTLRSGITNCPTENPKIKALVARHNVTFGKSFPGTSNPVLMRYYALYGGGGGHCDIRHARAAVRAFLATGMFEYVRFFEIVWITN